EVDLADVLQEELQRVGRDLARLRDRDLLLLVVDGGDDLHLHLLEGLVELVDLTGVEIELVECERDVVLSHRSGVLRRLEQISSFLGLEDVRHGTCGSLNPYAHPRSPSVNHACDRKDVSQWGRTMPVAADTTP